MTKSRKSLGTDLSALLGVANDNAQFDAEELIKWAAALRELNSVLKQLDNKDYTDNWKPWRRDIQGKKGGKIEQGLSNEPFLHSREKMIVP